MSGYTPQVGDRVRYDTWTSDIWVDVLHVDGADIFGRREHGRAQAFSTNTERPWHKVEKPVPLPERWINVYPQGQVGFYHTRKEADDNKATNRIAVLHFWTDEDGDHATIERVES